MTAEEAMIRQAMKRVGIKNRAELAAMIGVSDDTIRRKFRQPESMTLKELRLICEKTGLSIIDLIGGEDALQ